MDVNNLKALSLTHKQYVLSVSTAERLIFTEPRHKSWTYKNVNTILCLQWMHLFSLRNANLDSQKKDTKAGTAFKMHLSTLKG